MGLLSRCLTRLMLSAVIMCGTSGCARIFFHPMKEYVMLPSDAAIAFEQIELPHGISAWYLPANGPVRGTILFLHGNAENISTHIGSVYWMPSRGYNVLLLDYPGFGRSEGSPDFDTSLAVLDLGIEWALASHQPKPLFVLGQSMGGALSITALATSQHKTEICALVAESAFATYRGIARDKLNEFWLTHYLPLPLSYIIPETLSPRDYIAKLSPTPVLLVHGTADPIVGSKHSWELYERAHEPKDIWLVPGGPHIGAFRTEAGREKLLNALARFASRCSN